MARLRRSLVMSSKRVIIVTEARSIGLLVNADVILGVSIGGKRGDILGSNVHVTTGARYPRIASDSVPILESSHIDLLSSNGISRVG